MNVILIAVLLQLTPGPDGEPVIQVMATVSAEFATTASCKNAISGLLELGKATGFKINALCAPKDIAKLEVEKPPKKAPARGGASERGSTS